MNKKHDIFGNFQFFFDDYYAAKSYEISETEDTVIISIIAPGNKKEDISVELIDSTIKVRTPEQREKTFKIPNNVNTSTIEAVYETGILKITLNKNEVEKRRITIK